jgi:exoribonuclease R
MLNEIEIKKENHEFEKDKYVGVFQKSKNFGFVVLDDKKIKTDIYISKKNSKKAKEGFSINTYEGNR